MYLHLYLQYGNLLMDKTTYDNDLKNEDTGKVMKQLLPCQNHKQICLIYNYTVDNVWYLWYVILVLNCIEPFLHLYSVEKNI